LNSVDLRTTFGQLHAFEVNSDLNISPLDAIQCAEHYPELVGM